MRQQVIDGKKQSDVSNESKQKSIKTSQLIFCDKYCENYCVDTYISKDCQDYETTMHHVCDLGDSILA